MKEEGKSIAEIAKLMSLNIKTVERYLTEYPYSPVLARTMRHWSEILEALNGPRPLNVSSPIYKPTKAAKADEKTTILSKPLLTRIRGLSELQNVDYRQHIINHVFCDMWLRVFSPRHIVILFLAYQLIHHIPVRTTTI